MAVCNMLAHTSIAIIVPGEPHISVKPPDFVVAASGKANISVTIAISGANRGREYKEHLDDALRSVMPTRR